MSQATAIQKSLAGAPWQLRMTQLFTVVRIELRKAIWMRRSIWIYLLALAPTGMIAIYAVSNFKSTIQDDTIGWAGIFQFYYLRLAIFFGCMGLFTWLLRGEVVEKSLHYYFLAPVRREVLVAGKFLAGLIATVYVFGLSVVASFALLYSHHGAAGRAYVFDGPGLGQLFSYLGVTLLACVGYGALFLALSLVFKNPILPGAFVLLWETFHAVLPPLLQKLSVMFYLKQLCPVSLPPEGMMALFTVVAEPVSAWIAVPGLLCLCVAILVFACLRIRRMEISYLAD
jgi:ABC-type transport system involved in multi-copper enzyme maturation permease subunit